MAQVPRVGSILTGYESQVSSELKQPAGIRRGDPGEIEEREAPDLSQSCGCQGDTGRLVGLSAAGVRAEIGAVRFDQKPVQRNACGHVAQTVQALVCKRHRPGERKVQAELQVRLGIIPCSGKRMHYSPNGTIESP